MYSKPAMHTQPKVNCLTKVNWVRCAVAIKPSRRRLQVMVESQPTRRDSAQQVDQLQLPYLPEVPYIICTFAVPFRYLVITPLRLVDVNGKLPRRLPRLLRLYLPWRTSFIRSCVFALLAKVPSAAGISSRLIHIHASNWRCGG